MKHRCALPGLNLFTCQSVNDLTIACATALLWLLLRFVWAASAACALMWEQEGLSSLKPSRQLKRCHSCCTEMDAKPFYTVQLHDQQPQLQEWSKADAHL